MGNRTKFFRILALRLILSIVMASALSLLFFRTIQPFKTSLLAAIMLVLAYLFEYTKKRDKKEKKDG